MELGAEKVAVLHGGHHLHAVVRGGDDLAGIGCPSRKGVDKVHPRPFPQPSEQGRGVGKGQTVPADVGQLVVGFHALDRAGDDPQSGTGLSFLSLGKEQLHAQADAQHRLVLSHADNGLIQTSLAQFAGGVRECPHAGKQNGIGPLQLLAVSGDAVVKTHVGQGVGDAFQVPHPVVYNGGITHSASSFL